MARTTATNFSGGLQFPYATAATDVFHKEDIQTLAQAVDQHDHTAGKGHSINTVPANASITNAMLASDVARANLLTNGGFEVWQRGNGPFTGANSYCADRWAILVGGTDVFSISKDTTNQDIGSVACAAVTFTLGTGAGGSAVYQPLNPPDGLQVTGRTCSFSARVRTATANAVRIGAFNGSAWTYSAFHPGGGTYQTLTATYTPGTTANVGIFFAASCTAYLDNAMLVVGSQPADYAPLHPADDLARCLRYYETLVVPATNYNVGIGQALSASSAYAPFSYKVKKAVTPTLTSTGPFQFAQANGTQVGTGATLVGAAPGVDGCQFASTSLSGLVAGNASLWTGSLNSVLSIEANP